MKRKVCILLMIAFLGTVLSGFALTSGAVAVNEVFTYGDPSFGSANPTSDGLWEYEWLARETGAIGQMRWVASDRYYEAPFEVADAADTHWYCRVRTNGNNMHPGAQADSIKTFLCPVDGKVEFNITCTRQNDVTSYNGNSIRLFLNDQKVWPADKDQEELNDRTPYTVNTQVDVKKGDKLRFMVGSLGNSSADGVNVSNHYVKYLSGSELTPELTAYTVACVGDSVTEGLTTTGGQKGASAYPYQLQLLLNATGTGKYTVQNFGCSARTALTTGDRPYIREVEYSASKNCNPDVVIISFGANDSKPANWNMQQFKKDYTALIRTYMDLPSHPTVYIAYTTYVADQSKTSCNRETIQGAILPVERQIAKELGLKIIDWNTLTKNNTDKYNDGVHPNDQLQKMSAEYMFNALCGEGAMGLSAKNATATVKMLSFPDDTTDTSSASSTEPAVTDTNTDPIATGTDTEQGTETQPVATTQTEVVPTTHTEQTDVPASDDVTDQPTSSEPTDKKSPLPWILGICGAAIVAGAAVWFFGFRKKK